MPSRHSCQLEIGGVVKCLRFHKVYAENKKRRPETRPSFRLCGRTAQRRRLDTLLIRPRPKDLGCTERPLLNKHFGCTERLLLNKHLGCTERLLFNPQVYLGGCSIVNTTRSAAHVVCAYEIGTFAESPSILVTSTIGNDRGCSSNRASAGVGSRASICVYKRT